jgi:hypothetical protein
VNEIWNYGDLNIGGNIGTHPDVEFSYRYTCDSTYNKCTYKEVYDLIQNYDIVRRKYYILQSDGTYKQQSQSIFNNVVSGGAPPPYFLCGLPQN